MSKIEIIQGDWVEQLKLLPDGSVNCCVTSPPYWGLRDYGAEGQLGLEKTPKEYVAKMVAGFREVKRVLRDDGTLWLNLGDSYSSQPAGNKAACGFSQTRPSRIKGGVGCETVDLPKKDFGCKPKDLVGIPWMVAFALRADGWYLRQDIIWHKPNPMPESVTDRCTKSHEYIFLMSKSAKYYYDNEAIKEESLHIWNSAKCFSAGGSRAEFGVGTAGGEQWNGEGTHDNIDKQGRNKRSVWTVTTKPFSGAHFATFPPDLIEPCILAGCPEGGTVLDPFFGAGTTGVVCEKWGRNCIGIELNPEYIETIIKPRIQDEQDKMGLFNGLNQ